VHLRNAAAERGLVLHFGDLVHEEHELTVAGPGDEVELRITGVLDDETRVAHLAFAAHAFKVGLPALPVGRIGKHEMKGCRGESIAGKGGAEADVVRLFPLAFEEQIGLADGVGFGVDLLPEKMDGDFFAPPGGEVG